MKQTKVLDTGNLSRPLDVSILTLCAHMEEKSDEVKDCRIAADGTTSSTITSTSLLTDGQRERIARNKQKALALRRARVRAKPYDKPGSSHVPSSVVENQYNLEDTRGGFVLENSELEEEAIWQERHSGPAVQDDGKHTTVHKLSILTSSLLPSFSSTA